MLIIQLYSVFTLYRMAPFRYLEAANHASGEYEPGVDELALSGLTPVPSTVVKPPRVAEAAVQLVGLASLVVVCQHAVWVSCDALGLRGLLLSCRVIGSGDMHQDRKPCVLFP